MMLSTIEAWRALPLVSVGARIVSTANTIIESYVPEVVIPDWVLSGQAFSGLMLRRPRGIVPLMVATFGEQRLEPEQLRALLGAALGLPDGDAGDELWQMVKDNKRHEFVELGKMVMDQETDPGTIFDQARAMLERAHIAKRKVG